METLKILASLLRKGYINFRNNDPLILASSTAFFTTFSLSPILVILVNILKLAFDSEQINDKLFGKIRGAFGRETANQIENIVENVSTYGNDPMIFFAGSIFLLFVSTTLLKVVKQSINHLWHIKRKRGHRIRYNVRERIIATSLLLLVALLFLISLSIDTSLILLREYLPEMLPGVNHALLRSLNMTFSVLVVTAWFSFLFKFLPDAHVTWRVALVGGLITGIFFNTGKWILGKLLLYNNIVSIFGASASFALILLFIFYVGLILYFGASFTYFYGEAIRQPIRPRKFSEQYELTTIKHEVEGNDKKNKSAD
jgi:membrane protein